MIQKSLFEKFFFLLEKINPVFFLFSCCLFFANIFLIFKNKLFLFQNFQILLGVVFSLFFLLFAVLIWKKKKSLLTFVGLLLISTLLSFSLFQFLQFFSLFSQWNLNAKQSHGEMSLVVLKEKVPENFQFLENTSVYAPLETDREAIEAFQKQLKEDKNVSIKLASSSSYAKAYLQLLKGEAEVILLSSAYENLIALADPQYEEKIEKIYVWKIEEKEQFTSVPTKDESRFSKNSLTLYISGIDTYGPISTTARSDVNLILRINFSMKEMLLVTTPRDAYVRIAGGGQNQYDKLTHAGIYGVQASLETLENLYETDIDYYVRVNFTSFLKLIDLVGEIEVENSEAFVSRHGKYNFPQGIVRLDSKKALSFVRERYALSGGDHARGKNQQKVLVALLKKMTSSQTLMKTPQILQELSQSIQTNMPFEELVHLMSEQFSQKETYQIHTQALTGHGSMDLPSYAMPGYQLYMMQVDEASLLNIQKELQRLLEEKND